jgi:hypothetical protein
MSFSVGEGDLLLFSAVFSSKPYGGIQGGRSSAEKNLSGTLRYVVCAHYKHPSSEFRTRGRTEMRMRESTTVKIYPFSHCNVKFFFIL